MPIRVLIVTGTPYGAAALAVAVKIIAQPVALVRQRRAPTLASDLGHRAAEVEVDMVDRVLVAQDRCGLRPSSRGRRRTAGPTGPARRGRTAAWTASSRSRSTMPAAGDHLADEQTCALFDCSLRSPGSLWRPPPSVCSRHNCRYAALVMPAIGASTTGVSTSIAPSYPNADVSARRRVLVRQP